MGMQDDRLREALEATDPSRRLRAALDAGFAGALEEAKRVVALGGRVREADGELRDTRIPGIRSTAARAAGASCR